MKHFSMMFLAWLYLSMASVSYAVPEMGKITVTSAADCPESGFAPDNFASIVVKPDAPLYQSGDTSSPETVHKLPALTMVKCFAGSNIGGDKYRVLVSAKVNGEDKCGWVDSTMLLSQKGATKDNFCPNIEERKVRDYDANKPNSPLNLKLLVWNISIYPTTQQPLPTNNSGSGVPVPVYNFPGGSIIGDVPIYAIFPVFDFKSDPGDKDWFLIGSNNRNFIGWVRNSDTVVWDNRLTLYFNTRFPDAKIYYTRQQLVDAYNGRSDNPMGFITPEQLAIEASQDKASPKFPIINDNTHTGDNPPTYEIAFIGGWRNNNQYPSGAGDIRPEVAESLQKMKPLDVLFLIDATESMQPYFAAVAEAIKTSMAPYSNDTNVRLGVAIYGDFESRTCMDMGCSMQYATAINMDIIAKHVEKKAFDNLPQKPTYNDPLKDRPEAVFDALQYAATQTSWSTDGRHVIIHIGDNGPRELMPPQGLLTALKDNNILYIPVAVPGRYLSEYNKQFVDAVQNVIRSHKTIKGIPMGVLKMTYNPNTINNWGAVNDRNELMVDETRRALIKELTTAMDQWQQIKSDIKEDTHNINRPAPSSPSPNIHGMDNSIAGMALLTPAVREIYGVDTDRIMLIRNQGQLVAPGFVGKYAPNRNKQDQWDYFVAVEPHVAQALGSAFSTFCQVIETPSSIDMLNNSIKTVLIAMTGDSNIDFEKSFGEHLNDIIKSIPKPRQTLLKTPIKDLENILTRSTADQRLQFKKEICKSAVLFDLVISGKRLPPGNDVHWNDNSQTYTRDNPIDYNWEYIPETGKGFVYIPLEFFPK